VIFNLKRGLSLFLFLCWSLITQAEIYYVSPAGDDKNPGTYSNPWKTISYASTQASPGDVISLKSGTFIELFPSLIRPDVNLEGVGPGSVILSRVQYGPTIILMSSEGTNGSQYIANLTIDGDNLTGHSGILVSGRSNVSIHHCKFRNLRVSAAIFNGSTDTTDYETCIFFGVDTTVHLKPKILANGNKFFQNSIENCAIFYPGERVKGALMIGGQNEINIFDNDIVQDSRETGKNGYPIKYYRGGHNKNPKIFRNNLTKSPSILSRDEFFLGDAINLWHTNGLEIWENKIKGGIHLTYIKDAKIHHNTLYYDSLSVVPKTGIYISGDINNVTINNNYLQNFALQMSFSPFAETKMDSIFIYTNVMYNIGVSTKEWWGSGIDFSGLTSDTVTYLAVINNTMIANPQGRQTRIGITLPCTGYAQNIIIRNNIITGFRYATIYAAGPDRVIDLLSIENNILWDNTSDTTMTYCTSDSAYFTNIDMPLRYTDKNNLYQDPLFMMDGFHLSSNSPALYAGIYTSWITKDFEDNLMDNPPDIGAYAFNILIIDEPIVEDESGLLIYPVPLTNYFTLVIKDPRFEWANMELYDLSGRLIVKQKIYENITHFSQINLKAGVYIIKVQTSRGELLITKIIAL
jgi:hypothetical protein